MKLRRRERREDRTYKIAYKRLDRQSTPDVISWCDVHGTTISRGLNSKTGSLDDVVTAMICLEAGVDILVARS